MRKQLDNLVMEGFNEVQLYHNYDQNHQRPKSSLLQFAKNKIRERFSRVKKLQFFAIFAVCAGLLTFQIVQCAIKYAKHSTGTADNYVHVAETDFPDLTLCPTVGYKLDRLSHHGIQSRPEIQFGSEFVSKTQKVSPEEFYDDVVLKIGDFVEHVKVDTEQLINDSYQITYAPDEDVKCGNGIPPQKLFHVRPYYFFGDCYALTLPSCIKSAGILEILIDLKSKTDIFLHHEGQYMSPNSKSRVDVDVGRYVKVAVNHEVVDLLADKGDCVKDADFDGCMYEELRLINEDVVGCTVPWLMDKSNVCTDKADRIVAFESYQKNRRNQRDICPRSCRFTNTYLGSLVTGDYDEADVARAVFYFRREVKVTIEYVLYTWLSMLAEIGGYVGLLLGASVFKLAYINNDVLDWVEQNRIIDVEESYKRQGKY